MTPCAHQASGDVELYFYDELAPEVRAAVESHVRSCGECGQALEELTTIRSAISSRASVDAPSNGDWTPFMNRLAGACQQVRRDEDAPVPSPSVLTLESVGRPSGVSYSSALAMAALLTLATAGVVYVARSAPRPGPAPSPDIDSAQHVGPVPIVPASEHSAHAAFAALSEQHFERSKLVVLGLANKDPQRASEADWAYERGLATDLLSDTRLYRQAAEARGLRTLAGVMGDLEIVLLQTSLAEAPDADALGQIQRLIHKRDLVTKMDVSAAGSSGS